MVAECLAQEVDKGADRFRAATLHIGEEIHIRQKRGCIEIKDREPSAVCFRSHRFKERTSDPEACRHQIADKRKFGPLSLIGKKLDLHRATNNNILLEWKINFYIKQNNV